MSGDIVSEDAQLLISKFQERGSLQYEKFVEVWNELSFPQMLCIPSLCGDKRLDNSNTTLIELTHRLLQVGVGHMCRDVGLGGEVAKVAGLFLCYSVYFTQLLEVKVRIRVTVDDWEQLNKLYAHLKQNKMFQALYLLITLRDDAAFSICYTTSQMSLSYWTKDHPLSQYRSCLPESSAGLASIQRDIASLSAEYDQMKESLSVFLPPHLLEPATMPLKLEDVIKEYPKSTVQSTQ